MFAGPRHEAMRHFGNACLTPRPNQQKSYNVLSHIEASTRLRSCRANHGCGRFLPCTSKRKRDRDIHIYIYIYFLHTHAPICSYIYIHIYIYIYIYIYTYIHIYIYTYMYIAR